MEAEAEPDDGKHQAGDGEGKHLLGVQDFVMGESPRWTFSAADRCRAA
jgi:hypothetical protein